MRLPEFSLKIGLWCIVMLIVVAEEGRLAAESATVCPQPDRKKQTTEGFHSTGLPIDLRQVRELQLAFEDGHQPWRGDPVSVASVAVSEALGDQLGGEDQPADLDGRLAVECEGRKEAVVAGTGSRYRYKIYLKRLGQPGRGTAAIWTAIKVLYAPK